MTCAMHNIYFTFWTFARLNESQTAYCVCVFFSCSPHQSFVYILLYFFFGKISNRLFLQCLCLFRNHSVHSEVTFKQLMRLSSRNRDGKELNILFDSPNFLLFFFVLFRFAFESVKSINNHF